MNLKPCKKCGNLPVLEEFPVPMYQTMHGIGKLNDTFWQYVCRTCKMLAEQEKRDLLIDDWNRKQE